MSPPAGPESSSGETRCGFVAVIGAPNAGKSTLVNRLVGSKVSIVSPKVQTTRMRVLGIRLDGAAQVVLVDTPGLFGPKRRLERAMVHAARQGAADADMIVTLHDATTRSPAATAAILDELGAGGRRTVLALNKVDAVRRESLLGLADRLGRHAAVTDTFMISALDGGGVDDLARAMAVAVPPGPWLYPEDQVADMPMRLLAAEITREQVFLQLHDELPYETTVDTERWQDFANGDVRLDQTVTVQRDTQRRIVLGEGGRRIKAIGSAARAELEAMLERKVHLFLHVSVRERWAEERSRYRDLGLEFDPPEGG